MFIWERSRIRFLTNHHRMLPRRRKTLSREGSGFVFPKWEPEEAQAGWSALDAGGGGVARAGEAILQRCQGTTLGKTVLQVSQMAHCPQTAGPWACGERWRLFALAEPARRVCGCHCCEGCLSSCPDREESQGPFRGRDGPGEMDV